MPKAKACAFGDLSVGIKVYRAREGKWVDLGYEVKRPWLPWNWMKWARWKFNWLRHAKG